MTAPTKLARIALPPRVFITSSALRMMCEEACRRRVGGSMEDETGGVLFGRRLDRDPQAEILIVAVTGPGEKAFHRPGEFQPDVDYVNAELQKLYAEYPRLDYIGTWHKHPSHIRSFSHGDVLTAHDTFRDPSYKMYEIVNPIVWLEDEQVMIRYYYMSRPMAEAQLPFEELPPSQIIEVSDLDELVNIETVQALVVQTRQRLAEDRRRLIERGYQVDIHESDHEYFFTLKHSTLPDVLIYLTAPRGYPKIPPLVLAEHNGASLTVNDSGVISGWRLKPGTAYLVDVAEGVRLNILKSATAERISCLH